jgi:hypothetical protein
MSRCGVGPVGGPCKKTLRCSDATRNDLPTHLLHAATASVHVTHVSTTSESQITELSQRHGAVSTADLRAEAMSAASALLPGGHFYGIIPNSDVSYMSDGNVGGVEASAPLQLPWPTEASWEVPNTIETLANLAKASTPHLVAHVTNVYTCPVCSNVAADAWRLANFENNRTFLSRNTRNCICTVLVTCRRVTIQRCVTSCSPCSTELSMLLVASPRTSNTMMTLDGGRSPSSTRHRTSVAHVCESTLPRLRRCFRCK